MITMHRNFNLPFRILRFPLLAAALLASTLALSAARRGAVVQPDFTRGDPIPEGAEHDWNLGPTGARGWIYFEQLTTLKARQIRITQVSPDSPAAGKLEVGDVLLGAGGEAFSYDPRTELGRAITQAESERGGGKLAQLLQELAAVRALVLPGPTLPKVIRHTLQRHDGVAQLLEQILILLFYLRQGPVERVRRSNH